MAFLRQILGRTSFPELIPSFERFRSVLKKSAALQQPPVVDRFKNTTDARAAGDRGRGGERKRARSEKKETEEGQSGEGKEQRERRRERDRERKRESTREKTGEIG